MKRVAPELDGLMWTLAEEGNERAIDEFGARHPDLRGELIQRINMVKGLRSSKTTPTHAQRTIPRFVPREPRTSPVQARGPVVWVSGLVLAAVAAATFAVMSFLAPTPHMHKDDFHPAQQTPVVVKEAPTPVPKVETQPLSPPDTVEKGSVSEAAQKPTSLRVDSAPLLQVLSMMSDICGTKIVAAPGLANPNVAVDYESMSAMDMLRDLGKRYSFTPLDQNDGSILVVPAVDKSGVTTRTDDQGGIRTQKIGG